MTSLLTVGNPKTAKGAARGYLTGVLHLAPYDLAGVGNVCPYATPGCIATCLNTAGRGGIIKRGETTNNIQECRKRRTRAFFEDRAGFIRKLGKDILALRRKANKMGLKCAVRLNGTSDLAWHKLAPELFEIEGVVFYDYTKDANRYGAYLHGQLPPRYHLTFSASERDPLNSERVQGFLAAGGNVAAVYGKPLDGFIAAAVSVSPLLWEAGNLLVDGDAHDLRFLDPRGCVALLKAKGKARHDTTGFVYRGA